MHYQCTLLNITNAHINQASDGGFGDDGRKNRNNSFRLQSNVTLAYGLLRSNVILDQDTLTKNVEKKN